MEKTIRMYKHSGVYTLQCQQVVQSDIQSVWDFFSSPKNLEKITPPNMKFNITAPLPIDKMHAGQLITYKLQPFPFYTTNWVTEITQVIENKLFIDEQRFGPYAMWHHIHRFETLENGHVLMTDEVSYKLPFGIVGSLAAGFVKHEVEKIFDHRFKVVNEMFNTELIAQMA